MQKIGIQQSHSQERFQKLKTEQMYLKHWMHGLYFRRMFSSKSVYDKAYITILNIHLNSDVCHKCGSI